MYDVALLKQMYTSTNGTQSIVTTKDNLVFLESTILEPPTVYAQRGRPRVKRMESQSKTQYKPTLKARKCPLCHQEGHFAKTCRLRNIV